MQESVALRLDEAFELSLAVLEGNGFSREHARAIAKVICDAQRDECQSHGLYRLLVCVRTLKAGKVDPTSAPQVFDHAPAIVRVNARGGYSLLSFEAGLPHLIEKAQANGIAALAIRNCFHFSALWPEVERIAEAGMAGLAMNPSHSWVAPAGGTRRYWGRIQSPSHGHAQALTPSCSTSLPARWHGATSSCTKELGGRCLKA